MENNQRLIEQLKNAGFRAALLPFSYMKQILQVFDTYIDNSDKTQFNIKDWVLAHQPPKIAFTPLSFLVIAFRSSAGEICLNHKGKEISIPIPPTYLDDSIKTRLADTLKPIQQDYQLAKTEGVPLKMLAVLSGLGKYGRNALCYMDDFGSYCNFEAYYTDIVCEDEKHSFEIMDDCDSCGLCIESCPTGALGGEQIIDTTHCLTMLNESDAPMPDWLSPSVHHALVGCMRCQEICPVNKQISLHKKETLSLSLCETEAFLSVKSEDSEIGMKLSKYGIWPSFVCLAGRNAKYAVDAKEREL